MPCGISTPLAPGWLGTLCKCFWISVVRNQSLIGSLPFKRWSFETTRYFGADHLRVKETRVVYLRPSDRILDAVSYDSDSSDCGSDSEY
jgi:hypothetical protein